MDTNTTIIIILGAFVIVAIVALFRFRQRSRVNIRGPFNTGLDVEGTNEPSAPTPGIKAGNIKSRKGGLTAHDETGGILDITDVDVEKEVDLKRRQGSDAKDPKASPPL